MQKLETAIEWCYILKPKVFADARGFFYESYNQQTFVSLDINDTFIQDNHSRSNKWVLRGLHFQYPPYTQSKLVRVVAWSVLDIVLDLRKSSPSFGQYITEEISSDNKRMLYVPHGCAHGFLTLEDNTEFLYKCDNTYAPDHDGGILFSDPFIPIDRDEIKRKYTITEFIISDKDKNLPSLADLSHNNPF